MGKTPKAAVGFKNLNVPSVEDKVKNLVAFHCDTRETSRITSQYLQV